MALDTYTALQSAILLWLARPGDPLLLPSVPDMISLFEAEARRRLRTIGAEKQEYLYGTGSTVELPADFEELRHAELSDGTPLEYLPPGQRTAATQVSGVPRYFSIVGGGNGCASGGAVMQLSPPVSLSYPVVVTYQRGLPALSGSVSSNWLLSAHPDAYLFGSLVEAEAFIGADERALAWGQRRELAFASIEQADRKKRWPGAPLQMRTGMATP